MTKIINLFGGPGAGKTTMAGELFGHMKRKRMDVVYIDETAAHLVRSKSPVLADQFFVSASQHHKQYSILGEVEYIITDSPIILGAIYINSEYAYPDLPESLTKEYFRVAFKNNLFYLFDLYNNINIYIERGDREYKQIGRKQTAEEAVEIDSKVKTLLEVRGYHYSTAQTLEDVIKILGI